MRAALEITTVPQLNLLVGWVWLCLAFVSGLLMGLFFHRENWLGGYSSFRRRMYRLGHISFFGLGVVNLAFYLTAKEMSLSASAMSIAGWGFVIGAVSMPLCCVLMAHLPLARPLFSIPVITLLVGGSLVVIGLLHASPNPQTGASFTSDMPTESFPLNLDYVQSSNVSSLFRFSASTFNTSTFRIP